MILYFSGTGNSQYAAALAGEVLSEIPISINALLKSGTQAGGEYVSETPFVFVTPTYAWRIPHVVERWIRENTFSGCRDAYFLMTCGDSIGAAELYLRSLCEDKGLHFQGVLKVSMPENYIAMFSAPQRAEAKAILERAKPEILKAAAQIRDRKALPSEKIGIGDRLYSGIVNTAFYKLFVSAKGFYTTDACTGCGHCVKVCPFDNIRLQNSKPLWGESCTHCMACICRCPQEAIEYKKKSLGQPRYTAEKTLEND